MDLTFAEKSQAKALEFDFWCLILLVLKLGGDNTLPELIVVLD